MKVKNKILTAMVFGTILSGLIIPNKANAVLQSNARNRRYFRKNRYN